MPIAVAVTSIRATGVSQYPRGRRVCPHLSLDGRATTRPTSAAAVTAADATASVVRPHRRSPPFATAEPTPIPLPPSPILTSAGFRLARRGDGAKPPNFVRRAVVRSTTSPSPPSAVPVASDDGPPSLLAPPLPAVARTTGAVRTTRGTLPSPLGGELAVRRATGYDGHRVRPLSRVDAIAHVPFRTRRFRTPPPRGIQGLFLSVPQFER